jgi:LuxR family maltose regulon positive regulatory protein
MRNLADWYLGWVYYQRNELETAAGYFTRLVGNYFTAQMTSYRDAVAGLALIHQARGRSAGAWQMLETISRFDLEQSGSEDNRTRSLRARLQLPQGDLEGAGGWADALTDAPPDHPFMWLEEPQLTRARVLATRGAEADLRLALQILDSLNEIADRTHNTHHKIEILALHALALDALEDSGAADSQLTQALALARPGGFIRPFVDLGRPMQRMLSRLADHSHPTEPIIQRILAAFPADNGGAPRPSPDTPALPEPLTRRELEVLTLLRGPLSIKEIAAGLKLSYGTVRRHTINIYGKLGVNGRRSAVARAEELGILPPR